MQIIAHLQNNRKKHNKKFLKRREKREKFIDKLEINKLETNYERKSEKQKKYGKKEEPYFNEVHFNKTKLG